jgi:hypothetical protein
MPRILKGCQLGPGWGNNLVQCVTCMSPLISGAMRLVGLANEPPFKWFAAPNPSVCTDGYDGETPQAACFIAMNGAGHGAR